MNKYTNTINNRFQQMKKSVQGLISTDNSEGTSPLIELDLNTYNQLKQIAAEQKTSVEEIYDRAVQQYISNWTRSTTAHITLEQKERNPILYLDDLSKL